MTSKPNPALSTSHPDEPASQWASSTISALDPTTNAHPNPESVTSSSYPFSNTANLHPGSSVTTPGVDVPGAYPGPNSNSGTIQQDAQYVKDAAWNAIETAKGYAQTAGETVGGYLPTSVAAYLPQGDNTVPSQETSQNNPATHGGPGALPGTPGGVGVAKLPDQRTGDRSVDEAAGSSTAPSDVNKTAPITTTTNDNTSHPPSTVPKPSTSSTAAVSETMRQFEAMKLPEERTKAQETGPTSESGTGGASADASTRSLAGSRVEPSAAASLVHKEKPELVHHSEQSKPDQIHLGGPPVASGREHPLAKDEEKTLGSNMFRNDAVDMTSRRDKTSSIVATPGHDGPHGPQVPTKELGHGEEAAGSSASGLAGAGIKAGSGHSTSPPKKAGFMDKLKGEVKVLSGKLGHKEEKVEEGRRMMGKE